MDNDPKYEKQARLIARNLEGQALRWRIQDDVLIVLLTDGRKVNQLTPAPTATNNEGHVAQKAKDKKDTTTHRGAQ
jgi:hypothetical protein